MSRRAVDRPDFDAWRSARRIIEADAQPRQAAAFVFDAEGRGRAGVWIHGGPGTGIRIGAVHTVGGQVEDPATGAIRNHRTYNAVADAVAQNGTVSLAGPVVTGLDSRNAAAALLYGRWIERRAVALSAYSYAAETVREPARLPLA